MHFGTFAKRCVFLGLIGFAIHHGASRTQGAYGVTIGSPTGGSTWSAGANLTVAGTFTWQLDTAKSVMDPRPTSGIVYIHAGSNAGVVTNSGSVTISNVVNPSDPGTGVEDYTLTLVLTASTPKIGGPGTPPTAPYYVEVESLFQGVYKGSNYQAINVQNG